MKKYAYYHAYLTDETGSWYQLCLDQIFTIFNSGLYNELEKIYITCVGKKEQISLFVGICFLFDKFEIINEYPTDEGEENLSLKYTSSIDYTSKENKVYDETFTMCHIWDHANREDAYFLYFHTKGITAPWRMREEKDTTPAFPFVNYYLWRKFLDWGCIENWRMCVDALDNGHTSAGVNYTDEPLPHYSGTYWWSKSSYIKTLPDIREDDWWQDLRQATTLKNWDSNRNKPEMWIGVSESRNFYSIVNHQDVEPVTGPNLVWRFFPRPAYEHYAK